MRIEQFLLCHERMFSQLLRVISLFRMSTDFGLLCVMTLLCPLLVFDCNVDVVWFQTCRTSQLGALCMVHALL